ncbi:hypothetical protein [Roseobacter sp.]|uniref:Nmad2 family putative nucleotide modification protein n=1 Tax=Roseobacter sp. TaxID=1907202 RepID=UPI002966628B|nr:hypothetical protein [Roseobacter sp.]MDW3182660.1 hypothetical protein [Roseobacter sp.]
MSKVYIYVVDRDFGFAPNPFHGVCTLACCKDRLRATAETGDWVMGMGGSRLQATGKCVFGMRVTGTLTFDEYWSSPAFLAKQPLQNGSRAMMVGDNIYSRSNEDAPWLQADSHHSYPDGSPNHSNIEKDTRTNKVLLSEHFLYFGNAAEKVPQCILDGIGYSNGRNHRKFDEAVAKPILKWFNDVSKGRINTIVGDPFDFRQSGARYSAASNRIISD